MTSSSPDESGSWEFFLLVTVVIFGVNYPILKYALGFMPASLLNAVRLSLSAAILGVIYVWNHQTLSEDWRALETGGLVRILCLGAVGYGLSPLLFLTGMELTTAVNAAILVASAPIWTALVGLVAGVERLSLTTWVGLVVSMVGTVLVSLTDGSSFSMSGEVFLGNVILLVDAALWGGFTALTKPMLDRVSPLGLTVGFLLAGLVVLYAAALPAAMVFSWGNLGVRVWLAIVVSGGLGMGVALVWWNDAIKHLGPVMTGAYGNAIPLVGVAVAVLWLGETIGIRQAAGAGLILGGTAVVRYARNRFRGTAPVRLPG